MEKESKLFFQYTYIHINLIYYIVISACILIFLFTGPVVKSNDIASESNGCEKHCPINYDPICGTDESGNSHTFSNECFMKLENCEKRLSE